jgi:hypothetical protein
LRKYEKINVFYILAVKMRIAVCCLFAVYFLINLTFIAKSARANLQSSGVYTPNITGILGVDAERSALSTKHCIYQKIGNVISLSCRVNIYPEKYLGEFSFGVSLPVRSVFADYTSANGFGVFRDNGNSYNYVMASVNSILNESYFVVSNSGIPFDLFISVDGSFTADFTVMCSLE